VTTPIPTEILARPRLPLSDREHDKHVSQIGLIAEPSERAQPA
jgi:hypothetical protein